MSGSGESTLLGSVERDLQEHQSIKKKIGDHIICLLKS